MDDISNTNIVGYSAPWYIYANKIKYTYGCSKLIQVNDLIPICDKYILIINVSNDLVAFALRQVLEENVIFGNVTLEIYILNSKGKQVYQNNKEYTQESLAELFCTALKYNPLFEGIVLLTDVQAELVGSIAIVIEKSVVQFFDDDISELCNNFNEVASKVFKEVTITKFTPDLTVAFSTADENCEIQKQIFC